MSVNIRYPNITGLSEKEQLTQIKSYLHQLVDQLNYALPALSAGDGEKQTDSAKAASAKTYEVQGGELSYYELRSLVIQSLENMENLINQIEKDRESGAFDGADGAPGQDGYTPQKGIDYFTEAEISSVATEAAEKISFTLDEEGNLYYEVEE